MDTRRNRTLLKITAVIGLSVVTVVLAWQDGNQVLVQLGIASVAGLAGYEAYRNGSGSDG